VLYNGRFAPSQTGWTEFDDLADSHILAAAIVSADQVRIEDPLSFPWESIGEITAPTTVSLATLSLSDLAALAPMLETLTGADRLETDDSAIGEFLSSKVGTQFDDPSVTPEPQTGAADRSSLSKSSELAHRRILERLSEQADDETIILSIDSERLGSHTGGFGALVDEITDGSADQVLEIWGVRAEPGAALDGVVIAYRPKQLR